MRSTHKVLLVIALGVMAGCGGGGGTEIPPPTLTSVDPVTGPEGGGTSLTLFGSSLQNVTSVTVGGQASPMVETGTGDSVVCQVPAGTPGDADVTVTTPRGSATLPLAFYYDGAPTVLCPVPAVDQDVSLGAFLDLELGGTDDFGATLDVFLDVDGDLGTTGDQVQLAAGLDGTTGLQPFRTYLDAMPSGDYQLIVRSDDGVNPPVLGSPAGRIDVQNRAWAVASALSSSAWAHAVAIRPDGRVLVTGRFFDSLTLGVGEPNETTLVSAGGADLFLSCHEPDGTLVWAKRAGGSSTDEGLDVDVLPNGDAIVIGNLNGTATFGSGEAGETMVTAAASSDRSLARFDGDGNLVWARGVGVNSSPAIFGRPAGVAALQDGAIAVVGHFQGTATLGAGESNETLLTSAGSYDVFAARYASDGALDWAVQAGGTGPDYGQAVGVRSDGSLYIAGMTLSDPFVLGPGEPGELSLTNAGNYDGWLGHLAAGGTAVWGAMAGGLSTDGVHALAVRSDGSCAIAGSFASTSATFAAGLPEEVVIDSAGIYDAFLAVYGPDGTLQWATGAGGSSTDMAYGVAALADGALLVTGRVFSNPVTFGLGEVDEVSLVPAGSYDTFLARYRADGSFERARLDGSPGVDEGWGIDAWSDGSCVVGGRYLGEATFGLGDPAETILADQGTYQVFLTRVNASGDY